MDTSNMSLMEIFSNPDTMHSLTFGEKMLASTITMIMGLGITFTVLILIWIFISLMGKALGTSKKPAAAPAAAAAAPAPAETKAPVEEASDDSEAEDDYEYDNVTTTSAAKSDDDDTEYGRGSIMPNLVGLYYSEVEKKMGDEFTLKPKYYYSDIDERGYVKTQSIPEGADYDPKRKNELVLDVCAGPSVIPVPDFSGYSKSDYLSLLDTLNIKYSLAEDYSKSVAYDYVMNTSIPVGGWINIEKGDILTVTVSLGRPPETSTKSSTSGSGGKTEPQISVDTQDPWAPHTEPPVSSEVPGNTDQPEITDDQNGWNDNYGGGQYY